MSHAWSWDVLRLFHVISFLLQSLVITLKGRGITLTAKIALSLAVDLVFDWRYGTDTMRWVDLQALKVSSSNRIHGVRYQATKEQPFRRLLRHLDLPKRGTFVDLGAGKGRVLLLAAHAGFDRVRGIEFSAELCSIARQNVRLFMTKTGNDSQIEIVEEDVATCEIRDDDAIFFMYNAFGPVVIEAFLARLKASLERIPRDVWLIYSTPIHNDTIASHGTLDRWRDHEFGGTHFTVYRALKGGAAARPTAPHFDISDRSDSARRQ
jgi:SAM-dependent methyltransferase